MTRIELSLTSDADSWYFYNTVTSATSIKHFFTRHWYHWCNRKTLYCQNLYSLKLFVWNINNFEIREFPCIIKTLIGKTVSTYDTSFFRSSNYWDGLKINVWWRNFNTFLKHVKYRNANTSTSVQIRCKTSSHIATKDVTYKSDISNLAKIEIEV